MSIQISSDIENCFHNCLEEIDSITKDVWTGDISDGWQRTKKKSRIDIDSCFDIIKKNEKYTILESEFERLSIDEMMVEEFTKTYLYLSQNTVFEKSFFEDTWRVMNKKLDEPKRFYFFLGLYNFDTDYEEITLGEFKIKKEAVKIEKKREVKRKQKAAAQREEDVLIHDLAVMFAWVIGAVIFIFGAVALIFGVGGE